VEFWSRKLAALIQTFLTLIPIALLGAVLRRFLSGAEEARLSLNRLVLYAFLPALVFHTVMTCPINETLLLVPVVAGITTLVMLVIALMVFHFLPIPAATKGAMILAATFGNVISIGLPLLHGMFPNLGAETAASVVLFQVTTSNISLTLGAMIAIAYGTGEKLTCGTRFSRHSSSLRSGRLPWLCCGGLRESRVRRSCWTGRA